MIPNTEAFRKLLTVAFDDQTLTDLCFAHFVEVYEILSSGMQKRQKVQALLEQCHRHDEFGKLEHLVGSTNPAKYKQFAQELWREPGTSDVVP